MTTISTKGQVLEILDKNAWSEDLEVSSWCKCWQLLSSVRVLTTGSAHNCRIGIREEKKRKKRGKREEDEMKKRGKTEEEERKKRGSREEEERKKIDLTKRMPRKGVFRIPYR